MNSVRAFVSGGSNLDTEANLLRAARELKRHYPGARWSACWRNAAVGFEGPDFINFVVELPVSDGLATLKSRLQDIEALCGRPPNAPRWEPRAMDLDVLLFGDLVGTYDGIVLPRPSLLEWGFMLGPLAEIAPDLLHPTRGLSMAQLWAEFDRDANPLHREALDLAAA